MTDSPAVYDTRPVFVVSTGRCGSTLVSNMLRQHPAVLSLSELFAMLTPGAMPSGDMSGLRFWSLLSQPRERMTGLLRMGITFDEMLYRPGPGRRFTAESGVPPIMITTLPHLTDDPESLFDELATWTVEQPPRPVTDQYRALFAWLCERLGRRTWVERSGASLPRVPALAAGFPEARFVHLYRDGRDCALSMSRHSGYRLMHRFGVLSTILRGDPPGDRQPAASPEPPLGPDQVLSEPAPLDVMGRFWSDMVVQGVAHLRELGQERTFEIAYEQLVAEPRDQLSRLAAFIGVGADGDWLLAASALVLSRGAREGWATLSEAERGRLSAACAPGLQLLYGAEATDAGSPSGPATHGS